MVGRAVDTMVWSSEASSRSRPIEAMTSRIEPRCSAVAAVGEGEDMKHLLRGKDRRIREFQTMCQ